MSKIVDRPLQFEPLRKPYMRQTPTNLHWSSNHQAVPCTNMNSNTLLDWTNCQKEKQYRQVRSLKEERRRYSTDLFFRSHSQAVPKLPPSWPEPDEHQTWQEKTVEMIMLFFKKTCPNHVKNHVQHSACNHNGDDEAISNMTFKFICHHHFNFNHNFTALESPERPGQTCL